MNSQDLVKRAKRGTLPQKEIKEIAIILEQSPPGMNLYPLLLAIGYSNAVDYRKTVEAFLYCEREPMLAALALQILCDFWGNTQLYIEDVKRYVQGIHWDDDQDVRLRAISIAGEYLHQENDRELLEYLYTVVGDRKEEQLIRENAYCALARAAGRDWNELPSATRSFDLEKDIDLKILEEIQQRLAQKK